MRLGFHGSRLGIAMLIAAIACIPLPGCGSGSDGTDGANGASTGTLTGVVTNAMTDEPLAGAEVAVDPSAGGPVTTGADGTYSLVLPIGAYMVECSMVAFEDASHGASIVAATTMTMDMALDPSSAVQTMITGVPSPASPGETFSPTAAAMPFDGSTVVGYLWEQANSVPVIIQNETSATPTVILPSAAIYKAYLVEHAHVPDRWNVLPINPHLLEETEVVTLLCTVTTTSGEYTETVDVHAHLDFGAWTTGLRNVPTNVPVLMNGKEQGSYDWTLADAPAGNTATLQDATTKNPWFVPDAEGLYTLMITDETEGAYTIPVYVGGWDGGIEGVDGDGPYFNAMCVGCHSGSDDWNDAYDAWRGSGHAHIFTNNINTGGHYSSNCFACHTVGYDPTADNFGMDDQDDYDDFYSTMWPDGHLTPLPGNYDRVLAEWPNTARMTNIQCENCHGPNGIFNEAHNWSMPTLVDLTQQHPRMSTSSDVCAFCHGEPPRHARYQQWEESGHGNYELAEDESRSSCNYCHTAQGYINEYTKYLDPDNPTPDNLAIEEDDVHPITCVVCHDPHDVGTMSGHGTDAPMRVEDDAYNLACGFDVMAVGKGAQCMTCHNARRGLRNDFIDWDEVSDPDRASHGGPQTDVLMGQNAYFVDVGYRGAHSFLGDTCVTCHVELTPPPADLSYNLGGTNHTFEAKLSICSDCHGAYDGGTLADAFESALHDLEDAIEDELYDQFFALTGLPGGYEVVLSGMDQEAEDGNELPLVLVVEDYALLEDIHYTESHGRQAIDLTYDGTTVYHVQLNGDTSIRLADGTGDFGTLYRSDLWLGSPDELLAKCGWNYFLLHNDGSHGFHNPSFASDILVQTFYVMESGALEWVFDLP